VSKFILRFVPARKRTNLAHPRWQGIAKPCPNQTGPVRLAEIDSKTLFQLKKEAEQAEL